MYYRFQMTVLYLVRGMKRIKYALFAPNTPSGVHDPDGNLISNFQNESGQSLLAVFFITYFVEKTVFRVGCASRCGRRIDCRKIVCAGMPKKLKWSQACAIILPIV